MDGCRRKTTYTFNLHEEGSVKLGTVNNLANMRLTLTGTLNVATEGTGDITLMERTLMTADSFNGTLPAELFTDGCSFTDMNDGALTLSAVALDPALLTAEDLGKYYLTYRGNDILVQYVSRIVPEPTSASLSLLALAALALRRRR